MRNWNSLSILCFEQKKSGLYRTYEELKPCCARNIGINEHRSLYRTYEELKHVEPLEPTPPPLGLYRTYEELKLIFISNPSYIICVSLYRTYEELKLRSLDFIPTAKY